VPRPKWTPEQAREMAARGNAARNAQRELERSNPEQFFREYLARERRGLIRHLVDAVKGRGIFGKTVECPACGADVELPSLPAVSRLSALQTALAYSLGRPKAGVSLLEESPRGEKSSETEEGFTIE
jgi:hypothetical protein